MGLIIGLLRNNMQSTKSSSKMFHSFHMWVFHQKPKNYYCFL